MSWQFLVAAGNARDPENARLRSSYRAFRLGLRGEWPPRYAESIFEPLESCVTPALRNGAVILDVGGGRHPTIPRSDRPTGARYIGMDVSMGELQRAPRGSYDEVIVRSVTEFTPSLENRCDLIVSWNVLEHVSSMGTALSNLHRYLKAGGRLVAEFAGRYAAHSILGRVIPGPIARVAMARLLDRPEDTVFDAHYDDCYFDAVRRYAGPFESMAVYGHYRDATYFEFSRVLRAVYLGYEEWAFQMGKRNLATHYLVCAIR